jgi:hypothetical protein
LFDAPFGRGRVRRMGRFATSKKFLPPSTDMQLERGCLRPLK